MGSQRFLSDILSFVVASDFLGQAPPSGFLVSLLPLLISNLVAGSFTVRCIIFEENLGSISLTVPNPAISSTRICPNLRNQTATTAIELFMLTVLLLMIRDTVSQFYPTGESLLYKYGDGEVEHHEGAVRIPGEYLEVNLLTAPDFKIKGASLLYLATLSDSLEDKDLSKPCFQNQSARRLRRRPTAK
ncbi:hypothetical protein F4801DRAFT_160017 [Xylaria longipes]|nr:hypothetical protein F4801DRAFT_160017 [Xylaria longipes]